MDEGPPRPEAIIMALVLNAVASFYIRLPDPKCILLVHLRKKYLLLYVGPRFFF
jgi:hypothetical protein